MSVTSVVNLSDGLLGQPTTPETQGLFAGGNGSSGPPVSALPQDQFTPSSQTETTESTAQAAGIFSAPKTSALPSKATSVFASNASATNISSDLSQTGSTDGAQSGVETASAGAGAASDAGAAPAADSQGVPDSAASTATSQGSVAQQTQLNTLNNALAALGLSAADIQKIDQIASLNNDYDPAAFTSLVYQLEAQAQNASTQSLPAQTADAPSNVAAATKVKTAAA